jgi:hypothetical protein
MYLKYFYSLTCINFCMMRQFLRGLVKFNLVLINGSVLDRYELHLSHTTFTVDHTILNFIKAIE